MKEFFLIAAVSLNGIIGNSEINAIPWYLPSDLQHFKRITGNSTVVMGSRTYESLGKPLKNRRNVVITRNQGYATELIRDQGVDDSYSCFMDSLKIEREGFFVIGGEHIYGEALKRGPAKLFITIVDIQGQGDVRFPIEGHRFLSDEVILPSFEKFRCTSRSEWFIENDIKYQFTEFTRV